MFTNCGLDVVGSVAASAIHVVRVQRADALCNANLGYDVRASQATWMLRNTYRIPVTRARMEYVWAYPVIPPTIHRILAMETRKADCNTRELRQGGGWDSEEGVVRTTVVITQRR